MTRSMPRRDGRAPKGERVYGSVPLGPWQVTTLMGALALDGLGTSFTVNAATDADVFRVFGEQALAPALGPGEGGIGDHLPAHKAPALKTIIESTQAALLPWPPYSPAFNPMEPCWSKVKTCLRAAEARTHEAREQAIAKAFASATAADARG